MIKKEALKFKSDKLIHIYWTGSLLYLIKIDNFCIFFKS